ncbi:MAG: leucine-rich repeat domain-containing protein [Clostridia bacterium]|nr:leucine-rich repeat domain-containing protein [Clostridia bacterium]
MKKKILILLLISAMLAALFAFVGCFPTNGDDGSDNNDSNEKPPVDEYPSGDADGQEENYEYSFETDGNGAIIAFVNKHGSKVTSIEVPAKIGDEVITEIGEVVFSRESYLKSITLPEGLERIGNSAFSYCIALESIVIPDTVTELGAYAFSECESMKKVVLSKSLTSIEEATFDSCESLTEIELREGIQVVRQYAFEHCSSLENVVFPDTLTQIEACAYRDVAIKELVLPDSVLMIEEEAFSQCKQLKSVVLSAKMSSVANRAFASCESLTGVTVPSSINRIGSSAFSECKSLITFDLKNINASFSIGDYAFSGCDSLEELYLSKNISSIGSGAFKYDNNLSIYAESASKPNNWQNGWNGDCPVVWGVKQHGVTQDGVKWGLTVDDKVLVAGWNKNQATLEIPETINEKPVTGIVDRAFYNCDNLIDLIVPQSIETVGEYIAPFKNALVIFSKSQTVEEWENGISRPILRNYKTHGVTSDGYRWGLTNAEEMILVGYIGENLSKLKMPDSIDGKPVTDICNRAFANSKELTQAVLPSSLVNIGEKAFLGSNIKDVTFSQTLKSIGDRAFEQCGWFGDIKLPQGLISIGAAAFDYTFIKSVEIPDSVTEIGIGAFYNCLIINCVASSRPTGWHYDWAEDQTIVWDCKNNAVANDGYVYITENGIRFAIDQGEAQVARQYREDLNGNIVIPDSVNSGGKSYAVTAIVDRAFENCSNLTGIVFPDSIKEFGEDVFRYANDLKYNEYDNALYIGSQSNPYMALVKAKNNDITSCKIHENTRFILTGALSYSKIESVDIPAKVNAVYDKAFANCTNLSSVNIANGVKKIHNYAFMGCEKLTSVVIPISVNYLGYDVFSYLKNISVYCELAQNSSLWNSRWINEDDNTVVWGYNNITTDGEFDYVEHGGAIYITKYKGSSMSVTVPATIDGKPVVSIGIVFNESKVRSIELNEGIVEIDDSAFYYCKDLKSVVLPEGLISIGERAFGLSSLTSVYIPSTVKYIGEKAFYYCTNLTVNCQAESKPSSWRNDWNFVNDETYSKVVWGYVKG